MITSTILGSQVSMQHQPHRLQPELVYSSWKVKLPHRRLISDSVKYICYACTRVLIEIVTSYH